MDVRNETEHVHLACAGLHGKVAVVAGGAGGIGFASAQALSRRGATVVIADRDEVRGRRAVDQIRAEAGMGAFVQVDLTREEAVLTVASSVVDRFTGVDVLVNAMGIQRYGTALDTPVEVWDEVMAVNVRSMFLSAKAFLPSLKERQGAIVNVGSVQSLSAMANSLVYVTSKHAILGFTRALARDCAPDVRVNCVAPGSVDTPMLRESAHHFANGGDPQAVITAWGKDLHLLGRVATPEEVGRVVAFLATPEASFITGTCLAVDGGMLAAIR